MTPAGDFFQYQFPSTPQGWQCPICRRVYSPSTMMCLYCPGITVTTSSANTTLPDYSLEKQLEKDCPHPDTITCCTHCGAVIYDSECAEPTPTHEEMHA